MIVMLFCSCKSRGNNEELVTDEKKKIVIGVYFLSREISNQISTFARENEDYEVVVKEYMNYSEDELSDDKDLYYQLNLDIISGNIPDIMIFNSDMPIEHYISKGILSDLTPFF